MSRLDWVIIFVWVAGTSAVGMYFGRGVATLRSYLQAGRTLPWWLVAIVHWADSVDPVDFISSAGLGYRNGLTGLGAQMNAQTYPIVALSRWLVPRLYRGEFITNAEFLEQRYTRGLRLLATLLQTLYRTLAIGAMIYALSTLFQVTLQVGTAHAVVISMLATGAYTFFGGQVSSVMASLPQVVLMVVATVMMSVIVWIKTGGAAGILNLYSADPAMLRLGGRSEPGIPTLIFYLGMMLSFIPYPLVNQTVMQRCLAARSETHARVGTLLYLPMYWLFAAAILVVGLCGPAFFPGLSRVDSDKIYPMLMIKFLPSGLLGLMVAAMLLAAMSTASGVGTAIAGLLTVDIYRRFFVRHAPDAHYLKVARWFSLLTILFGTGLTLLVPRVGGIIPFFVSMVGTLILPLSVPFLAIRLFPAASRRSGMTGVVFGLIVGITLMIPQLARTEFQYPLWLGNMYWRPIWVFAAAWLGLLLQTLVDRRRVGDGAVLAEETAAAPAPGVGWLELALLVFMVVLTVSLW